MTANLADSEYIAKELDNLLSDDTQDEYAYFAALNDSPTYDKAMDSEQHPQWMSAMQEEMDL